MFPLPAALKPVTVPEDALAVQLKVVPVTLAVGVNETVPIEQIDWVFVVFITTGTGLTVTTKLKGVIPIHDEGAGPTGVITYVTVSEPVPELVNTSEMFPLPDA